MASDRRKSKHDPDVFCSICGCCFNIQTVTENIRFDEKSVFINKLVFKSFATFNLQDWVIENLT